MTQQFHSSNVPKRTEDICSHKNLYMDVHSSIIHNSQKIETTQMSINQWMDKQSVVYTYSGISFSHKKGWSMDACYNRAELLKHAKWKKPHTKDHML